MGKLKNLSLFEAVKDFLTSYLPKMRKSSPQTIRAYRKALELFFDYLKAQNNVKLYKVSFGMITRKSVEGFLDHIENERECGASTRNHRLQVIKSFLNFAAESNIYVVPIYNDAQKIKKATAPKPAIGYLNDTALETILSTPDTTTRKGLRDMFIMTLLYQSGARIAELLDIRLCDISLGKSPTLTLCGKGRKTRIVPLRDKLVEHLKKYILYFHADEADGSEAFMFYTIHRGQKCRMTEDNARKLIKSYGELARKQCSDVPENVHPHLFRHTRAMHLYQNGVDLTLVSQWLGHTELDTTLIYAQADTEMKRKAIEKAVSDESPLKTFINAERFTVDDDELLKQLYGLK
jgi:site-specific recombinase XerD